MLPLIDVSIDLSPGVKISFTNGRLFPKSKLSWHLFTHTKMSLVAYVCARIVHIHRANCIWQRQNVNLLGRSFREVRPTTLKASLHSSLMPALNGTQFIVPVFMITLKSLTLSSSIHFMMQSCNYGVYEEGRKANFPTRRYLHKKRHPQHLTSIRLLSGPPRIVTPPFKCSVSRHTIK